MYERATISDPAGQLDPGRLLLVVVGAHPQAERSDRPLATRLCKAIEAWQTRRDSAASELPAVEPLVPLTCTDLWQMNDPELQVRPTISLGRPDLNATTAWLGSRLPTALLVEGSIRIHLDPELLDHRACLWGAEDASTAAAVDLFVERYLDDYLEAVHDLAG